MAEEAKAICPECGSPRPDMSTVCPMCGAPPRRPGEKRAVEEEVRTEDLEPYVTLRYIARMFKILAALIVVMMIAEVVIGLATDAAGALATLVARTLYLLVMAGFLWAGGDITILLIDLGHDIRVARILLGRINAVLHSRKGENP